MVLFQGKRRAVGAVVAYCLFLFQGAAAFGQGCVQVDRVDVRGATLFRPAAVRHWSDGFAGRCLGLDEFNRLLERVTLAYVDKGYVAARAYQPEQDLADGSLEIAVIEGKVADITFNGTPDRRWERMVFPGLVGLPVQIRRVEQGLDHLRAMNNREAKVDVDAGADAGDSILRVTTQSARPWAVSYSTNNHGVKETGRYSSTLNFSWDHLLGLNDQWTLTFGKTMRGPFDILYDGQGNKSLDLGLTLPYGPWEFSLGAGYSRYFQEIDGIFTPIPVSGHTTSASFLAKRLLHRDQDSKTHLSFGLDWSDSRNYIAGAFIDSSSRRMTVAALELSHSQPLWKGQLGARVRLEKGISWFGAEDPAEQPAGAPDAQFLRWVLSGTYDRTFEAEATGLGGPLTYAATAELQASNDPLYGGQQFAIGGPSTVRGVTQALARGSSGVFLRNEITYQPPLKTLERIGNLSLYAGLDYGRVLADADLRIAEYEAVGGSVGLRMQTRYGQASLTWSEIVADDSPGAKPPGVMSIELSTRF